MSNRLNATYGVASLDALLKLGEASVPRRIANEIYFIRVATIDDPIYRGRWAQYLPDSVLAVDESTVWYPRDSGGADITNQGRWILFAAGQQGSPEDPSLIDALKLLSENSQSGTTYTLVLSDGFKGVTMDNANTNTVTIPLNSSVAFPVGSQVIVHQIGAGQTTITGATGVTLNGVDGGSVAIVERWSAVTLWKRGENTWSAIGGIA